MKLFGAFTADGFKGSIELLRFMRDLTNDQRNALATIIGPDPVFISGGTVTEDGGNTTITDGMILKEGKFYAFSGGTYPGIPTDQMVKFAEETAAGYPDPYNEGDPVPKKIYLDNTAMVDDDGDTAVTAIGYIYSLEILKSMADSAASALTILTASGELSVSLNPNFSSPTGIKIKRSGNWYRMEGWLKYTGAGTSSDTVFANVASDWRPPTGTVLIRPVSGFDFGLGPGNFIERHLVFSEITGNLIISGPLTTDKHFDLGAMIFYKE